MIGLRTGLALGLRTGAAIGIGADAIKGSTVVVTTTTQTVTVVDSADPVITGGDAFFYTVQYTNTGSVNATGVSVAVTLDASLAYVSASGTGWSIGRSGQVVTCTQASIAPGAANAITINVTTGTSGVSASTSAAATADNATTANGSQGTTVNLVSKDATAGIYVPASSAEWTNFIARKALSVSAPSHLWLAQEATGALADSIGSVSLTVSSAPSAYNSAVPGWTRTGVQFADAGASKLIGTLPVDTATNSCVCLVIALMPSAQPSGNREIVTIGTDGATSERTLVGTSGTLKAGSNASVVTGATNTGSTGTVVPLATVFDRANSVGCSITDTTRVTATFSTGVTGTKLLIGGGNATTCAAFTALYIVEWEGAAAEMGLTNLKALETALGFTASWT